MDINALSYNIKDVASKILDTKNVGEKLGWPIVYNIGEIYNLGSPDPEEMHRIYQDVLERKPGYDYVTEALKDLGLLRVEGLDEPEFDSDKFVKDLLSVYNYGVGKVADELIYLDSVSGGVPAQEGSLDSIYNKILYKDDFASIVEVYDKHGLLVDPIVDCSEGVRSEEKIPVSRLLRAGTDITI